MGLGFRAQNAYFSSLKDGCFHPQRTNLMFVKCHIVTEGNHGQKLKGLVYHSFFRVAAYPRVLGIFIYKRGLVMRIPQNAVVMKIKSKQNKSSSNCQYC